MPSRIDDVSVAEPTLVGDLWQEPGDPLAHPCTGIDGRLATNLSGGLKARGHPVGGTGLFQLAETWLQLVGSFPNARAQLRDARFGICQSIGGSDSRRERHSVPMPRRRYSSTRGPRRGESEPLSSGRARVEAATTIFVTAPEVDAPVNVALLQVAGRRVFARLERPPEEGEEAEGVLAGQTVRLLVKDDGDPYFEIPRSRGIDLGRLVDSIRRRIGG